MNWPLWKYLATGFALTTGAAMALMAWCNYKEKVLNQQIHWTQAAALMAKIVVALGVVLGVVSASDATQVVGQLTNAAVGIVALCTTLMAVVHFNSLHKPTVASVKAAANMADALKRGQVQPGPLP